MEVTKIGMGECPGCQETRRLVDGACPDCRKRWGNNCGPIMRRVRTDSKFALACYRSLRSDREREKFVTMFGDPRPERESG